MDELMVDCRRCVARGPACHDCVISVLLGLPEAGLPVLAGDERHALGLLADAGLLPPLRLVVATDPVDPERFSVNSGKRFA